MDVSEIFNLALSSLTNPIKTARDLAKKKLSLIDGVVAVVLGALVPAVIFALLALLAFGFIGAIGGMIPFMGIMPAVGAAMGLFAAINIIIVVPIASVVAWFICSVIVWIIASVLGGKGNFETFAGVWAFPIAAMIALTWIPIVGFLMGLYGLYLLYVFLQPTMKMDSNKAAITVLTLIVLALLFGSFGAIFRY